MTLLHIYILKLLIFYIQYIFILILFKLEQILAKFALDF